MRVFDSGASRDTDDGKLDYEAFMHPEVVERFAEYMHANRTMADGSTRDGDNWQKGMPRKAYMKSAWRHFWDWWMFWRTPPGTDSGIDIEETLCAVIFNAQGFLYEHMIATGQIERYVP